MTTGHEIPLIERARAAAGRVAIEDGAGANSYADLLAASENAAAALLAAPRRSEDLGEERVAFLVPPEFAWPAVLLGIWRAGGIAVPLAVSHPRGELEHVIADSGAAILVAHPEFRDRLAPIAAERGLHLLGTDELLATEGTEAQPSAATTCRRTPPLARRWRTVRAAARDHSVPAGDDPLHLRHHRAPRRGW